MARRAGARAEHSQTPRGGAESEGGVKVLNPGYWYELDNFENAGPPNFLRFIQKLEGFRHDGTTNEEVLHVLIDRLRFQGNKLPSRENSIAITKLEEALMWLEKRTADRQQRGVEVTLSP
jgi:hypothetical protein